MAFYREWAIQFKSYNRNIRLTFGANILTQIGLGIFMVIYNFYIRELGYSDHVNGQIISMTALATAIVLVPAGMLSDRIGRKNLMLFGVFATGIVLMLRSIVHIETFLIIFGFVTGITTAFLQVSVIPWLSENSNPQQRVHLFSIHFALMTAANVIGNMAGGILTDLLSSFISQLMSIRITLLIGGFIFLLGVIPIFRFKEGKRDNDKIASRSTTNRFNIQKDGLKVIILFAIAQMIIGFGSGLVVPYLNLYFADRFSISNSLIGLIISLGQAATAIAMIIGPLVVQWVGEVKAVVYLQLLSLPFLLLTAFTENLWLAILGFLFRQALMNAGNPIQMSLMMSKVNSAMRGLASSVNQMVFNLGWAFMGPVSTGIVMKSGAYWGYAQVFSMTSVLYVIGSLYFFFVFKSINRQDATESEVKLG